MYYRTFSICILISYICYSYGELSPRFPPQPTVAHRSQNVTMFKRLHSKIILEAIDMDRTNNWLFANDKKPSIIFDAGQLKDESNFKCIPSNGNCNNLLIHNVSTDFVGQYVRSSHNDDRTIYQFTSYKLAAFERPGHFDCAPNETKCSFNKKFSTLSLLKDEVASVKCFYYIWQSKEYKREELTLKIGIFTDVGEICESNVTLKVISDAESAEKANKVEISKVCDVSFDENNKNLKCFLIALADETNKKETFLDGSEIQLDIQYPPIMKDTAVSDLNKIVGIGQKVSLVCPFDGYPLTYIWTDLDSQIEVQGEKVFQSPDFSQEGIYLYQCKANASGLINEVTPSVNFTIKVTAENKESESSHINIVIWVLASVGLALLIAIAVILVIFKLKMRKKPKAAKRNNDKAEAKPDEKSPLKD